jgi:hypothetical protein
MRVREKNDAYLSPEAQKARGPPTREVELQETW